jgi:hypothetical protein
LTADIVKAGAAADAAANGRAQAAATTTPVDLCVAVLPAAQSTARGQATTWTVSAWATGGNVPAATIQLTASPAGAGTPVFSSGCVTNGTPSCSLGAVDATAATRQFQAQFTVPTTATTVSSVTLTAIASTTNLPTDPKASGSMSIFTSPDPLAANSSLLVANSSLSGLTLLGVAAPSPSMSPGGNASGLFPTLNPSSSTSSATAEDARQVANTSSPTETASPTGAEVAGLAALALAVVLAVTRLSIRRPASPAAPAAKDTSSESPADKSPEKPEGSEGPDAASGDESKPDA